MGTRLSPWVDGIYRLNSMNSCVFIVTGETVKMEGLTAGGMDESISAATWKFGEFEEAHPEVAKHTGKKNNNVDITLWGGKWLTKGVVSKDGKKITIWGKANEMDSFEWISEEEYAGLKDSGDPADAPPSHYKIRPEYIGKLLFISGAPGLGKSTSGLLLSKTAGYVYYEADAFFFHDNPYIPPDVDEPSLATHKQKPLKGVPQDRIDAVNNGMKDFMAMIDGKEFELRNVEGFYTALCKDITAEKKRMGGDWVVAQAVTTKALRDHIRKQLGPECIFVVLNMTKEDTMKRITARHGEGSSFNELLIKWYDFYEPATKDEENAIDVVVTSDMSREDVVQKILKLLPK